MSVQEQTAVPVPPVRGRFPAHDAQVERLSAQYAALPPGAPVRLAKRTSNLFRARAATDAPGLDVASLDGVLAVDPVARTAVVQGMCTYEHLVDATLEHGLMPCVVPQLRTITLGGAVSGLGIEATSFRHGCPHESVLAMQVLTGDGRVLEVTPDGEHADLFAGFPNSYGSLGYALALTIELLPVRSHVRLEHVPVADHDALAALLAAASEREDVDFVDGVVFGADEQYVTLGSFVEDPPYVSDYTGGAIFYRSLPGRREDFLTTRDFLWRWDTDWFWCSRALYVQKPWVRPLVPRRWLRSDVYFRVVGFERRHGWWAALEQRRGLPAREEVVQDVEVPVEHLAELLRFLDAEVGITPLWVCPLRQRDDRRWPLYPLDPGRLYVNVGFWSSVPIAPGAADGDVNRAIEAEVARLDGHKSLYSTAWYDRETFHELYGGATETALKARYDPDGRLRTMFDKCVGRA